MAILTERQEWRRPRKHKSFQLSELEQARMKFALHALRVLMGGWGNVAKALGRTYKATTGASEKRGNITGTLAIRIAHVAGVSVDALLGSACPMCRGTGRLP